MNRLILMKKLMFSLLLCSVGVVPFVFLSQWAGYIGLPGFEYSATYRTPLAALIIREGLPILFIVLVILTHQSFFRHRCFTAIILFICLAFFADVP